MHCNMLTIFLYCYVKTCISLILCLHLDAILLSLHDNDFSSQTAYTGRGLLQSLFYRLMLSYILLSDLVTA